MMLVTWTWPAPVDSAWAPIASSISHVRGSTYPSTRWHLDAQIFAASLSRKLQFSQHHRHVRITPSSALIVPPMNPLCGSTIFEHILARSTPQPTLHFMRCSTRSQMKRRLFSGRSCVKPQPSNCPRDVVSRLTNWWCLLDTVLGWLLGTNCFIFPVISATDSNALSYQDCQLGSGRAD